MEAVKINSEKVRCCIADVVRSAIKQKAENTLDAYCPSCASYIVNQRVTFEERCDKCGTHVEWR